MAMDEIIQLVTPFEGETEWSDNDAKETEWGSLTVGAGFRSYL